MECFRVRGIPFAYDESKTAELLKHVLGLDAKAKMRVRSLAPETYPCNDQQMATVDFETRPPRLSKENPALQWAISCKCENCNKGKINLTVDSNFKDITVLHWPKEGDWKMDVIAVSGLGGHAFGSFKAKGGTEMWLRDYLPQELPGARIVTFGYDSHLVGSNSFQDLTDLGITCRDALDRIKRLPKSLNTKIPTVLVGHSLGGLVLKEAVLSMMDANNAQCDEFLASIAALLFFGVPNHGMDIESLVPIVSDQPNEGMIRALSQDSDRLFRHSQQFLTRFQGKWKGGVDFNRVRLFSFYETKESPTAQKTDGVWKMNGPPTVLVGKASATNGRAGEVGDKFVRPVDADHSGLVKFASRQDKTYLEVLTLLREYA